MAQVVALIHEEDGTFGASFPDFPGCTTAADDVDTLFRKAAEVLAFHVGGMVEDGRAVPRIRSLSELREDATFQEDGADAALVGVVNVELPGKAVRVNISIEEGLLASIDLAAKARGETRSGFLARSARERIGKTA